ncbi:TPA: TraM recognition domain-containing protein [Streptococcus suis]
MMVFLLSLLPYKLLGKRSLDIVLFMLRTILWLMLGSSVILFLGIILLSVFRIRVSQGIFSFSLLILFFNLIASLYIGLWNTRLTSRQLFILFNKFDKFLEKEREKTILKFIKISSLGSLISGLSIVIFALNNYIMAYYNQQYVIAENYLKYANIKLTLRTLSPLIGNQFWNSMLLIFPVFIISYLLYNSYRQDLVPYYDLMKHKIKKRFYKEKKLAHLFDENLSATDDVILTLGVESDTKVPVSVNAEILRLNMAAIGPIGSGKSASFAKVALIQFSEQVTKYLRAYHDFISKQEQVIKNKKITSENEKQTLYDKWFSDGVGKGYINGFYVNEPSGDLIGDTRVILNRVGIPREMVWLIDPTKEDTDSINIFDAETTMAAGMTSDLIRNFSEDGGNGGNTFFKNAESAYVKNLVVMLKTTARIEGSYLDLHLNGGSPTMSDFYKHLEEPELVVKRLKLLHVYVKAARRNYEKVYGKPYQIAYNLEKEKYLANGGFEPLFESKKSSKLKKLFEEKRIAENKIEIIEQTFNYFHNAYQKDPRTGIEYITHDANIEGMKNTIRKLASSELVRRIFFSPGTKDIDIFLKQGGFLLVNTARGPIDDDTSRMVGQITDMIFQKAVFRRNSSTKDPFFAAVEDEYGWVTTANTERFLNQNRKYNVGVIGLYQNIEQVEADLGKEKTDALFNSYRNLFAFQGGSKKTFEQIVERAGVDLVVSRMMNRGNENILAGNDNNSSSIREQFEEKDITSNSELFRMEQFQFAGIIVKNDEESELLKITPTPSFKTKMFEDGGRNYSKIFDIENNSEDKDVFNTWLEQTERKYRLRFREERIPKDMFTSSELDIILGNDEGSNGSSGTAEIVSKILEKQKPSSEKLKSEQAHDKAKSVISDILSSEKDAKISEQKPSNKVEKYAIIEVEKKEEHKASVMDKRKELNKVEAPSSDLHLDSPEQGVTVRIDTFVDVDEFKL